MPEPNDNNLNPSSLKLAITAFMGLLILALGLYGVKPNYLKYEELTRNNSEVEDFVANLDKFNSAIESRYRRLSDLENELLHLQGGVSSKQIESHIVQVLQNTSWSQNVVLLTVTPDATRKILDFDALRFEVTLSGSYFNLYAWIQEVYEHMDFIVIEEFGIAPVNKSRLSEVLEMKISLLTYRVANS